MEATFGRWPRRKTYKLNMSMIALLRYRSAFGVSFFSDFFAADGGCTYIVRLIWAAIEGTPPNYNNFLRMAAKTRKFPKIAKDVQSSVLMTTRTDQKNPEENHEEFDELDILAMMAVTGISMDIVHTLPVFLILDVISKRTEIMGGKTVETPMKFRKMSGREVAELYGG